MHLCTNCQKIDWDDRLRKAEVHSKALGKHRAYCPHCTHVDRTRFLLPHPANSMCERCAKMRNECEACGKSTLESATQASIESFEALFDSFVSLVKTYGFNPARSLLTVRRDRPEDFPLEQRFDESESAHIDALVGLELGLVDSQMTEQRYYYRRKRPIWTLVWGQLGFNARPPRCESCPPPPRSPPAMVRAERCGHWTAGHQAAWCLPCAVERRACSVCEASTE